MIALQPFIEPVRYRTDLPPHGRWTNVPSLCVQAGIRQRATAPVRPVWIYTGTQQIRAPHADAVGVPVSDLTSVEAALRALEALAHSFHDHAVRASVCGRGLFVAPPRAPSRAARFWSQHDKAMLHARHVSVLDQLLEGHVRVVTSSSWARMAACSHDTASRDIKTLVALGILTPSASGGRSTRYEITGPW